MREYTVNSGKSKIIYKGFNRQLVAEQPEIVAIYLVDGDTEVWVLDDNESLKALDEHMRDEPGTIQFIGVFHRDPTVESLFNLRRMVSQ